MPGTLAEPSPDPDDEQVDMIFRQMMEGVGLDENDVVKISEVTVSSLTDFELSQRFNDAKQELYQRGELLNPTTDTGKDIHAMYHGYLLEMKKRRLM